MNTQGLDVQAIGPTVHSHVCTGAVGSCLSGLLRMMRVYHLLAPFSFITYRHGERPPHSWS